MENTANNLTTNNQPEHKSSKEWEDSKRITNEDQNRADDLSDKGRSLKESVTHNVNHMLESSGKSISRVGTAIKDNAPANCKVKAVVEAVGESIESSGDYLAENAITDISKDVTETIRQHPIITIGLGVGLGMFLGNMLSRKCS